MKLVSEAAKDKDSENLQNVIFQHFLLWCCGPHTFTFFAGTTLYSNAEGVLIGFYAENAAGQLTHHGQRSHVHAIVTTSAGGKAGGHVDGTGVREGASLFLPASTH